MRKFEEMKQIIIEIKGNEYTPPAGVDLDGLIADMLRFVGDVDSDLREGIYSTFGVWSERGVISTGQMRHILNTAMDEQHLFLGIGEKGTDTVFMRAFSSLLVALSFCMQDEQPFLTKAEIQGIKETVLRYVSQEKDYRGYVEAKGWAHAIAHAADALANIAGVDKAADVDGDYNIGRDSLLEILEAVKMLAINSEKVYDTEEDERLAEAVLYVFGIEVLTEDEMHGWITDFSQPIARENIPTDYYRRINQKHFMRSLYFKLMPISVFEKQSKFLFEIMTKEK